MRLSLKSGRRDTYRFLSLGEMTDGIGRLVVESVLAGCPPTVRVAPNSPRNGSVQPSFRTPSEPYSLLDYGWGCESFRST
jgi:hypothetical protein